MSPFDGVVTSNVDFNVIATGNLDNDADLDVMSIWSKNYVSPTAGNIPAGEPYPEIDDI